MKKIVLVLVAAMVLVFTGCEKKETISMPFDVADVNNIEMYRNAEPYSAEKQVITESEDIADLYSLFSGLEVSDKKTEPVVFAGGVMSSDLIRAYVTNRVPGAHFVPGRFASDNAIGISILAARECGAWPTTSM